MRKWTAELGKCAQHTRSLNSASAVPFGTHSHSMRQMCRTFVLNVTIPSSSHGLMHATVTSAALIAIVSDSSETFWLRSRHRVSVMGARWPGTEGAVSDSMQIGSQAYNGQVACCARQLAARDTSFEQTLETCLFLTLFIFLTPTLAQV
jgi:hypothetical protein